MNFIATYREKSFKRMFVIYLDFIENTKLYEFVDISKLFRFWRPYLDYKEGQSLKYPSQIIYIHKNFLMDIFFKFHKFGDLH